MSSLARCEGRSEFKRGRDGRREAAGRLPRSARTAPSAVPDGSGHHPTTGAHGAGRRARSPDSRAEPSRAEPGGVSGPPRRTHRPAPSPRPRSRRAPSPSMRLLAALLLLLLLALCAARVDGSKCKCSRKGPKIRYSDVKKLEMKPKYPHCEEKMVIVTTKSVSRYRGQEHCLHPKLQSTKRFIKWYNAWNEKRRVYEE